MKRQETVIVTHGLWMNNAETALFCRRLESAYGLRCIPYHYRSMQGSLAAHADKLERFAQGIVADRLHFVGHSLGGIIVTSMMESGYAGPPGRVVCLGSPLAGCEVGAKLSEWTWGRQILGPSVREVVDAAPVVRWSGERDLGIVAGTHGIGLGRLLTRLEGPHDGSIKVSETRLPGATDHIELHVSHTGMLFAPEVVRQVGHFLGHGRFLRD